ncbi:MAG: hypothetical protein WBK08_14625 [Nitrospira sp.]|jgi:hypothetical protein|nr:MAG: hypothetical protein E8D42_02625 [Nitrospira sp.]
MEAQVLACFRSGFRFGVTARFLLEYAVSQKSETNMQVICSWCREEGRVGFIGEKAPLGDCRETHSICLEHLQVVRARWTTCQRSTGLPGASIDMPKEHPSHIRWAVRSVVRLCVGLRGLAQKTRG